MLKKCRFLPRRPKSDQQVPCRKRSKRDCPPQPFHSTLVPSSLLPLRLPHFLTPAYLSNSLLTPYLFQPRGHFPLIPAWPWHLPGSVQPSANSTLTDPGDRTQKSYVISPLFCCAVPLSEVSPRGEEAVGTSES